MSDKHYFKKRLTLRAKWRRIQNLLSKKTIARAFHNSGREQRARNTVPVGLQQNAKVVLPSDYVNIIFLTGYVLRNVRATEWGYKAKGRQTLKKAVLQNYPADGSKLMPIWLPFRRIKTGLMVGWVSTLRKTPSKSHQFWFISRDRRPNITTCNLRWLRRDATRETLVFPE